MSQQTTSTTLSLPWVDAATRGFVNAQAMREAISLAIAGSLNVIFSGPGGHGKSEFLNAVFASITGANPYVKSFGQGTSNEELYGGLDFDALNRAEGATIQFKPELSFLEYPTAVFEELFDAPPRVLTSLKDTLTAKELRNGHQRHAMRTRVIAAATNHSPLEIAQGGPEIAALIERFPIQLEVKWDSYDETAFLDLFEAVTSSDVAEFDAPTWDDIVTLQQQVDNAVIGKGIQRVLAKIIIELRRDKVTVSPRTAVLAMKMAKAAAVINGRSTVIADDLVSICFLPGAYSFRERIQQLINEFGVELQCESELSQAEDRLEAFWTTLPQLDGADSLQEFSSLLRAFFEEVRQIRFTDSQRSRKHAILDEAAQIERNVINALSALEAESMIDQHREQLAELSKRARRYDGLLRDRVQSPQQRAVIMSDVRQQIAVLEAGAYHESLHAERDSVLSLFNVLVLNHRNSHTI